MKLSELIEKAAEAIRLYGDMPLQRIADLEFCHLPDCGWVALTIPEIEPTVARI